MSEVAKIILTALFTLLGGVILLVLGQFLTKLVVEPLQAFQDARAEISFNLIYYANVISNPDVFEMEKLLEVSIKLREMAARLESKTSAVLGYSVLAFFRLVPKKENVSKSVYILIALSNGNSTSPNYMAINNNLKEIKYLLGLKKQPAEEINNLQNNTSE